MIKMQKNKLDNNIFLNFIYTVSNLLFPFITFPYVSKILGPQKIGMINYAEAVVIYFTLIASLGINLYATRECAKIRNNKKELSMLVQEIFLINLSSTVISYLLLIPVLSATFLLPYKELIIVYSFMIGFTSLGLEWLYAAVEDFEYITYRTLLLRFIIIIFTFLVVKEEGDYKKYAILQVTSNVGTNLINIFYSSHYISWKKQGRYCFKRHIKPIFYIFILNLSINIFTVQDKTMLGMMTNDENVGYYATAYKITGIVSNIINSIGAVVMSRLSFYLGSNQKEKFDKLAIKAINMMLFLSIPAVMGVCALAKNIVWFIGGKEYEPVIVLLKMLIVSIVFSTFNTMTNLRILFPLGKEKVVLKMDVIAMVENIILNLLLIPLYQAKGAVISTVITEISIFIFCLQYYDFSYRALIKTAITNLGVSIAMVIPIFLICHILQNDFYMCLIGSILGGLLYLSIQWRLKNENAYLLLDFILKKLNIKKEYKFN